MMILSFSRPTQSLELLEPQTMQKEVLVVMQWPPIMTSSLLHITMTMITLILGVQ